MKNIIGRFCLLIFVVLLLGSSALAFDLIAIVVKSKTVVRQTPDSKGKVLLTAKKNRRFSILLHKKGWIKVVISSGNYGWIPSSDVTTIADDSNREGINRKREQIF